MKMIIRLIIGCLFISSCTVRRSFDTELRKEPCGAAEDVFKTKLQEAARQSLDRELRSDACVATWDVYEEKLQEAASIFTAELDYLQQTAPGEADVRADLLFYASVHFPGGRVYNLEALWRNGCQDPHPAVRLMAMKCVTQHLERYSARILTDIAEHSRPEVRDDILQYLQKGAEATKE